MYAFTQQECFTIDIALQSLLDHVTPLLHTIPIEQHGELKSYIDITKRLRAQIKPDNLSVRDIAHLLDEYDNGLSKRNRVEHPFALPLVRSAGEKAFAKQMRDHLQAVYDHSSTLMLNEYSFYYRGMLRIGIRTILPRQIMVLSERIDAYQLEETIARQTHFTPMFKWVIQNQNHPIQENALEQEVSRTKTIPVAPAA